MTELPILVHDLSPFMAKQLACPSCGFERPASDDEIDKTEVELFTRCPTCPDEGLTWKFVAADPCPNCGKLGWWSDHPGKCCSRLCQLQHEYRQQLTEETA